MHGSRQFRGCTVLLGAVRTVPWWESGVGWSWLLHGIHAPRVLPKVLPKCCPQEKCSERAQPNVARIVARCPPGGHLQIVSQAFQCCRTETVREGSRWFRVAGLDVSEGGDGKIETEAVGRFDLAIDRPRGVYEARGRSTTDAASGGLCVAGLKLAAVASG